MIIPDMYQKLTLDQFYFCIFKMKGENEKKLLKKKS
jgi:hypothetical protein